jgi:hypothetical protein
VLFLQREGIKRREREKERFMENKTDFSVVPFRLNSMLFSEKKHVKALKNQWALTMP